LHFEETVFIFTLESNFVRRYHSSLSP
jgi:hypothetical protein